MPNPSCAVDGCEKPTRSAAATWCSMHYHRWYRHGSTDRVSELSGVSPPPRRYRRVTRRGHPLADRNGSIYVHRLVLWDQIGPMPTPCHWCGTEVHWAPKGEEGELLPDHLDEDGGNNDPSNLVPSCRGCNTARGSQRRSDELRAAGWWSSHDTVASLGGRRARVE